MKAKFSGVILVIVIGLVFGVFFSAAAQNQDEWEGFALNHPEEPGWFQYERAQAPYRIGISVAWTGNAWRTTQKAEIEAILDVFMEAGIVEDWKFVDAGGDVIQQKRNIRNLMEWGMDALIVDPVSPEALVSTLREVTEKGVLVLNHTEHIPPERAMEMTNIQLFGSNYLYSGYLQGKFVAEQLIEDFPEEKRKVLVLRGVPGAPSNIKRYEGAEKAIEEYPTVEIVGDAPTDWSVSKAKGVASDLISAHPNARGWITQGAMTMSAIPDALEEAGQDPGNYVMTGEDFVANIDLAREYGFKFGCVLNPQTQMTFSFFKAIQGLMGVPIRTINKFQVPMYANVEGYPSLDELYQEGLPSQAQLMTFLTKEQLKEALGN